MNPAEKLGFDPKALGVRLFGEPVPVPVVVRKKRKRKPRVGTAWYLRALEKARAARKALVATGLTCLGQPRKNKVHPELHGLPSNERRKLWMRWKRGLAKTTL